MKQDFQTEIGEINIMLESYEEYLKRTNQEDTRESWKWWKIEVYGMSEVEAIKASVTMYEPLKR